jgi:hypothetical protein
MLMISPPPPEHAKKSRRESLTKYPSRKICPAPPKQKFEVNVAFQPVSLANVHVSVWTKDTNATD